MFSSCMICSKMTALKSHMCKMCLVAEESPQANRKQENEMCLFSFMLANSLGALTGAILHDVLFWNMKAILLLPPPQNLILRFLLLPGYGCSFIKQNLMWLALRPLWWCMCKISRWKKTDQDIYVVWLVWKKRWVIHLCQSMRVLTWDC